MKKRIIVHFALIGLIGLIVMAQSAKADVVLADWCVNLNGDIATACNGGGSGGGGIDLSNFDPTLSPANNTLGSIKVTLLPGSNQYVSFYADYDISFATYGSFDDYASLHGALPAGLTYELDDPNVSNIFNDFAGNTLANTNNVGTPGDPANNCCDVSFALSLSGINPGADGATATFVISSTAPSGGFYIQQTNQDTGASIYLQGEVTDNGVPQVPEPSTLAMGLAGVFLVAWRHFRTAR
jgi:hypothetical protein